MTNVRYLVRSGFRLGLWLALLGVMVVDVPGARAQFGLPKLPKVPKIGKQEQKPPAQAKQAQGPAPEVLAITPSSVPPGWEGDVVFTGKNFAQTMKLRMECGYEVKPKNFRVESAERAVFQLKVPPSAEEAKCIIALEVPPVASTAETGPAAMGTPMVVQVTGANFAISESSNLAKAYKACFLAEGDLPPMGIMMKVSEAMQKGSQDECRLYVSSDSVKYSAQGKAILDQPASAVKTVDQILMMGNPTGAFRIVLTSGKIYNFFASGSQSDDNPLSEQIKNKLKK